MLKRLQNAMVIALFACMALAFAMESMATSQQPQSPQPHTNDRSEWPGENENRPNTNSNITSGFYLQNYSAYCAAEPEKKDDKWRHEFWCEFKITDAVIAAFTVILAIVTAGLIIVGVCQIRQVAKTMALARDEFLATHRPELIVREIAWAIRESGDGGQNGSTAIAFTLVNRGRNFCEIVASVFEYSTTSGNGQAVRTWGRNQLGPVTFEPGQFRTFPHDMRSHLEQYVAAIHSRGEREHYFRGTVTYADRAKVRRRFAFTRYCAPGSNRFLRTDDPEDEYTD